MTTKINTITAAICFTLICSGNALATPTSKQETQNEIVGFGSGALIGTAMGGPLGGLVAGIIGVLIAEDVNSDNRLEVANETLALKDQELIALQQNFEQSQEQASLQIAAMDKALQQASFEQNIAEMESNIQFKTGSFELEDHYQSQLDLVAETLTNNPHLIITLSGFADKRGDDTFNQALSEQRALAVKNYLVGKNVKDKQVLTYSYGETSLVSTGNYYEDDFFDRRVTLKVSSEATDMTAANQ